MPGPKPGQARPDVKVHTDVFEDHRGRGHSLTADLPSTAIAVRVLHHYGGQVPKPIELVIKDGGGKVDVVVSLTLEETGMLSRILEVLYENGLVYRNVAALLPGAKKEN
jgi:hypothetical protein